jgi:hypothetical protein
VPAASSAKPAAASAAAAAATRAPAAPLLKSTVGLVKQPGTRQADLPVSYWNYPLKVAEYNYKGKTYSTTRCRPKLPESPGSMFLFT